MSLLPSKPDAEPAEDAGPRVVGVDDDEADDVLSALSSGTARRVLAELHDEPAPPSDLADRVDTSLQNIQYHLEKLKACGAIEIVDTAYSAKGRKMDVYAPADQPLVVFAGDRDDESTLRTALSRLLGAIGFLAVGSLVVQYLYGNLPLLGENGDAADGGSSGGGAAATPEGPSIAVDGGAATPTPQVTQTAEVARTAAEGSGIPPGLLFFAGGLFVLGVVVTLWYLR